MLPLPSSRCAKAPAIHGKSRRLLFLVCFRASPHSFIWNDAEKAEFLAFQHRFRRSCAAPLLNWAAETGLGRQAERDFRAR
jgi:hypothetical protein